MLEIRGSEILRKGGKCIFFALVFGAFYKPVHRFIVPKDASALVDIYKHVFTGVAIFLGDFCFPAAVIAIRAFDKRKLFLTLLAKMRALFEYFRSAGKASPFRVNEIFFYKTKKAAQSVHYPIHFLSLSAASVFSQEKPFLPKCP